MSVFDVLSPQLVFQAVEAWSGWRLDGSLVPYNSHINRVYGVKDDDGKGWVVKFYRPDRWNRSALEEEHALVNDAAAADLPVARPVVNDEGDSLGEIVVETSAGELPYHFAVFEKKGGRNFDAEGDDDWLRLGRLLGRLHRVGRDRVFAHRPIFTPATTLLPQIEALLDSRAIVPDLRREFEDLLLPAAQALAPLFEGQSLQRIHGDCHRGNILDRPGEGLLLMDFDDCAWGPPIQDLWLLLPGYREDCPREVNLLSEGYSEFQPLGWASWDLVEPLRLMRMVHFLAWCHHQRGDRGFEATFPGWGSKAFWIRELEDLTMQVDRLPGEASGRR
ncbi:MAG: serine/threonine protein kinase [Spirochaetales bacterium]